MPDFEVTSPTGQKFKVTGPEGATQEDALAYAQQQFQQPQPQTVAPQPVVPQEIGTAPQFMSGQIGKLAAKPKTGPTIGDAGLNMLLNGPYDFGGDVTDLLAKNSVTRPAAAPAGYLTNLALSAFPMGIGAGTSAVRPEVNALLKKGIVPTVGQAADTGSVFGNLLRKAEDSLMSVRGVGDVIAGARNRTGQELNRAALNTAMPAGEKVSQVGNAGLQEIKDSLGAAYDKLYAGKDVTAIPQQLYKEFAAAKTSTTLPLNAEGQSTFDAVIRKAFWDRLPASNTLPAANVKQEMIGDIGKAARNLSSSSVASERATGEALQNAKGVLQNWLNSATGAKDVGAIDKAWQAKIALEGATKKAAAQGGVFTPYQLLKASKPGTELNKLAENAQAVMGNNLANSGTADRALLAYMLENPTKGLMSLAGTIPAGAFYSWPVQNFLVSPGPRMLPSFSAPALAGMGDLERRAMGGPVNPGQPYLVGENGPELMIPQTQGTITPMLLAGDPMGMAQRNAYKQAVGASIDASEARPMQTGIGGVVPIPPNVEGLAKLLVSTGRAKNIQDARVMAVGMAARRP